MLYLYFNILDCPEGKYGVNCASTCGCVRQFTSNCNKVNGKCECIEGRQGNNCTEDVDECKSNSSLCTDVENLTCDNTIGSYRCLCKAGFTLKIYNQQELCEGIYIFKMLINNYVSKTKFSTAFLIVIKIPSISKRTYFCISNRMP